MNTDLNLFVRECLSKGIARPKIKSMLDEAGWQNDEIIDALSSYHDVNFPVPVPNRKPYLSAKEAYLYLLMFITMYFSAANIGVLLFTYIDRWFPDRIDLNTVSFQVNTIRWGVAALVIAFPIFLYVAIDLHKAIMKFADQRASKIRKWLTYFTLFIAASIIIGDLISLMFSYLSGHLTEPFVLKVLVILAITGTIFGYYLTSLRSEEEAKVKPGKLAKSNTGFKIFLWILVAAIVTIIVYGLSIAGSPASQRQQQFDDQRISNLQEITRAVKSYYTTNNRLPSTLVELQAGGAYVTSITDPETSATYQYTVIGDTQFQVCATFGQDSTNSADQTLPWKHRAGLNCFSEIATASQK